MLMGKMCLNCEFATHVYKDQYLICSNKNAEKYKLHVFANSSCKKWKKIITLFERQNEMLPDIISETMSASEVLTV